VDSLILIVGGGLGGLTAALALARHGQPVHVLEGAPAFGAIGYGIQFGPNVFHVLDRIGVSDVVLEKADSPPAVLMIDALNGKEVTRVPTGPSLRARFKYPYIIIHRIDLHNVMLDACKREPLVTLVPDAMVTHFDDRDDGVTATTADGRSFKCAALIGADGIRSSIRSQLLADGDPLPNGFMGFRTIVPMSDVVADVQRDVVALWGGPGFHMVHYPLRHGALFNIAAVFRRPAHSERGDAAHPTLQSLAQGACMAIEDGQCLADCIVAANGDYEAAFRRYESARAVRTARVTLESRYIWDLYHSDGITRDVYWQMLSERGEADTFQCLAWLYDGFALPMNQTHKPQAATSA
jgi:3-hydroxybenzoate 6-monooxygenase